MPSVVHADVKSYFFETEYQPGKQEIRVLLPDDYVATKPYPVVYVLPVERGFASRWGDGLGVMQSIDAANRFDVIVVQIGFAIEPWFADHASKMSVRQDSYLREFVVPWIETNYSTSGTKEGRILFGFSKSGWGAVSLILKHPDFYGYAVSWDAPMMFNRFRYTMKSVYGTQEQLDAYRPDLLVKQNGSKFVDRNRIVLTGVDLWGKQVAAFHEWLDQHGVKHHYDVSQRVRHRWDRRWVEPSLEAVMKLLNAAE